MSYQAFTSEGLTMMYEGVTAFLPQTMRCGKHRS
jgi:hypothetical protein